MSPPAAPQPFAAFHIRPAITSDIPLFTPIANAAFAHDSHTLMKDAARGAPPGVVQSMDASWFADFVPEHEKVAISTAVVQEGGQEKVVGYVAWAKFNWDGKWPEAASGETLPPIYDPPEPLPSTASRVDQLEHHTSTHFAQLQNVLNPRGQRRLYILGIALHPSYHGRGIGRALIERGTTLADKEGVPCWVHASEAGAPAFRACGFEEVDRLTIDLDEWATTQNLDKEGKVVGDGKWGEYTFRYMIRQPKSNV